MFGKLLKHDMRSIGRTFWIIAVSMLGLSLAGGASLRFVLAYTTSEPHEMPDSYALLFLGAAFLLILCLSALFLSLLATEILLIARFYKNFFTDEGYLTFTLPVTRRQLLFSKFLNACIWFFSHMLWLIVCVVILLIIGLSGLDTFENISTYFELAFSKLWDTLGAWLIVFAIELVLLLLGLVIYSVAFVHFAFTIGGVHAKKNKILVSIGVCYLSSMVFSIIFSILMIFGSAAIALGLTPMLRIATTDTVCTVIALLLALVGVVMATLAVILYNITLGKLERRLNLA